MSQSQKKLRGEYANAGEYHRELSERWPYYPVYVEKMKFVRRYLDRVQKSSEIVDLGCGEGLLVEEYRAKGYRIQGLDANYSSEYVKQGDLTQMGFNDGTFDLALVLDVLE
ncbi:MAG: methyltransferase domain-containing protein, partial [Pseudomonadota bacterium]